MVKFIDEEFLDEVEFLDELERREEIKWELT